jgi:hypothetical protein
MKANPCAYIRTSLSQKDLLQFGLALCSKPYALRPKLYTALSIAPLLLEAALEAACPFPHRQAGAALRFPVIPKQLHHLLLRHHLRRQRAIRARV